MKSFVTILIASISTLSFGQDKIKTVQLSDTIISAGVDRAGDFYFLTKEGQIQKFDKDGKLGVVYRHHGPPTLFDPRDGARLFAYYRNKQQYDYHNPSFEIVASYKIDSAFAIEPWLIAPSGEKKLWILDNADHSLKKINPLDAQVEVEVIVDATLIEDATAFTAIREYQNFVFLLNPSRGIFVFNSLGKHIKIIPVNGVNSFNFLGEELYYMSGGQAHFTNLFTAESRQVRLPAKAQSVLLTDERMVLVNAISFDIYEYKP